LDGAVIARYKSRGEKFEIYVDPDMALSLHNGEIEDVDPDKLLAVEEIFEDAKDGKKVSESSLKKVFGKEDVYHVAKEIIRRGEVSLTTKQRREMREKKRRKVVSMIARDAIDPQTKRPHPPARIEKAMEEAKVNIDPLKSTDVLVEKVVKAIRPIIPIKFEKIRIAIRIPASYAGKSWGEINNFGKILKEEWKSDGSWTAVVEISAALQSDFYGLANRLTRGEAETELLRG
jgi:ribosome maturation protein SDO1